MTKHRSTRVRLFATTIGLALCVLPMVAAAQEGPFDYADDHFLCYKGKLSEGSSAAGTTVALSDMFESGDFEIKKERGSCNPADKNGEGIVDAATHLTVYQIKAVKGGPKHEKQTGIRVFDQFGDFLYDTLKPDRLLVPAAKDDDSMNPLPTAPPFASHNVDHYKCYKIRATKDTPAFAKGVQASVEDQWESPAKTYDLKKPKLLCLATDRDGELIKNPLANMMCYQAKPAKGEAKHVKRLGVGFADELVAHRLDSSKEELLCVPALKDPPAEFCGDGVVNQSEECDGDDAACPAEYTCVNTCQCKPPQCGDGIVNGAEQCDGDATPCAVGEACTTSCTCMDAQCPDTVEWARDAFNSDWDVGYTGASHNGVLADQNLVKLRLSAVTGSGPSTCGVATIAGIDPSSRMCRCLGDNRTVCDEPFQPDVDDCGGALCQCYLDAPHPSNVAGAGTCTRQPFTADVTGTWNLDTGEAEVVFPADQVTTLELSKFIPCPICVNDVTMNDGIRDGTCSGGKDNGLPCDAQGEDVSYVGGGATLSLDCFASGPQVNAGLFIDHHLTTGVVTLDVGIPCGATRCDHGGHTTCNSSADCGIGGSICTTNADCSVCSTTTATSCTTDGDCPIGEECLNGARLPECSGGQCFSVCDERELCHCGRCDGDGTIGCASNADCGVDGPCAKFSASIPQPNSCSDGTCTSLGEGQGECQAGGPGDIARFCDGILLANGTGIIACQSNADCEPVTPGSGNCTSTTVRSCFTDSMSMTGSASTTNPLLVSAQCNSPTGGNPAANIVGGYPGPGMRRESVATVFRCAGDPSSLYPSCP